MATPEMVAPASTATPSLPRPVAARPAGRAPLLAICSDLDETPDADTYFETLRFLNTTEPTRMGTGVGLEVGNTLYFDMAPGHFSYWNATDKERAQIRALIKSGHIDCLHSYGDLATTRSHAGRALEELAKYDCRFTVWIDHAQAITNFGSDIMQGRGDDPTHPAYHADLTLQHGIRHVWRGRITSVIGQNRPFSLRGVAVAEQLRASGKTLAKETAKQLLAQLGNRKYSLHAGNRLTSPRRLRDGQVIQEFMRCQPSWIGVGGHDRGDETHQALNRRYLDRLVEHGGASIFYTHLGKLDRNRDRRAFDERTVSAFRLLAEYHHSGRIHVTTTARVLQLVSEASKDELSSGRYRAPSQRLEFPTL